MQVLSYTTFCNFYTAARKPAYNYDHGPLPKSFGHPCFAVRAAFHLHNVWSGFLIHKLKPIKYLSSLITADGKDLNTPEAVNPGQTCMMCAVW
jgi:hypothetical protein